MFAMMWLWNRDADVCNICIFNKFPFSLHTTLSIFPPSQSADKFYMNLNHSPQLKKFTSIILVDAYRSRKWSHFHCCSSFLCRGNILDFFNTETQKLSWRQCYHWGQSRLSWGQHLMPSVTTKLASWQPLVFSVCYYRHAAMGKVDSRWPECKSISPERRFIWPVTRLIIQNP